MVRDARLVLGKDLRLEWRSRWSSARCCRSRVLVLVLFAFALDPDRRILEQATPGLFWLAVLFSTLLALQRSFAVEAADGVTRRPAPVGPRPGRHLPRQGGRHRRAPAGARGRCSASGVTILYGTTPSGPLLLVGTCLAATAGLAAVGSLYGVLSAGLRVPRHAAAAPAAAGGRPGADRGHPGLRRRLRPTARATGGAGSALLAVFALLYLAIGIFAFDPLLEES